MITPVSPRERWLVATLVLGAAALRFAAAANDLGIDEVWSLEGVRDAGSITEILRTRHDNNHLLNSLYLLLVRDSHSSLLLRALSIVTGTAAVWVLWQVARRLGAATGLLAAALATMSYPLVLYSSEARGYAPALLCTLLAWWCHDRWWDGAGQRWRLGFWTSSLLGLLSHLTFVFPAMALVGASLARARRRPGALRAVAVLHAPVAAFTAALWLLFARGMLIGGADPEPLISVLLQALRILLGAPASGAGAGAMFTLLVAVLLAGFVRLGRDEPGAAAAVAASVAVPLAYVALVQPPFLQYRYVLLCFPFLYVALAHGMSALPQSRWVASVVLLLFAIGNVARLAPLYRDGRGQYCRAVATMGAATAGPVVAVGSDHDFRNGMMLRHFARCLPADQELLYLPQDAWPKTGPEWFVTHSLDPRHVPVGELDVDGRVYRLAALFPFGGDSGLQWSLYHRVAQ